MDNMKTKNSFFSNLSNVEKILIAVVGLLLVGLVCVASFRIVSNSMSDNDKTKYALSTREATKATAVYVATDEGYTVTSGVCEVVSSERFIPWEELGNGQIVFYAYRVTKPSLNSDVVVLFSSDLTVGQGGSMWIFTINENAHRFFPDFPYGPELEYPININTDGAQDAIECAQQAESSPG